MNNDFYNQSPPSNRPGQRIPVRKFKRRRKKSAGPFIVAAVLSLIVVAAFILLILAVTGKLSFGGLPSGPEKNPNNPIDTSDTASTEPDTTGPEAIDTGDVTTDPPETDAPNTEPPETDPPVVVGEISYTFTEYSDSAINSGLLVLIDNSHEYIFPTKRIVNIYNNKTKSYVLSTTNLELSIDAVEALNDLMDAFYAATGNSDVMVSTAYRSYAAQETLYANAIAKHGEEWAAKYSAKPGFSDYNCGEAFQLQVYRNSGIVTLDAAGADYAWITSNCYKYGIIQRYPTAKASITGNNFEPYHFRYVGIPHAAVMKQENLCLEEYLEYVRSFPYSGEHLKVTVDSVSYEIFYVEGMPGGTTNVPIPDGYAYNVSGDNIGGFIVAVTLK